MISLEEEVLSRLRGCATLCRGGNGAWCVTATNVYGGIFGACGTGSVRRAFTEGSVSAFTEGSVSAFTTEAAEIDVVVWGEFG